MTLRAVPTLAGLALLALAACVRTAPEASAPAPAPALTQAPAPAVESAPVAPTVAIESPAEGAHVRTNMVPVRGRASGVQELYLNSERVHCKKDGTFDVRLELPGPRAEIVARDRTRPDDLLLVRRLVVDLEAPVLELVELPGVVADGKLYRRRVDTARVTVRGRATDTPPGAIAGVTVDGQACAVGADGAFQTELEAPASGERLFELEALDRAGNRARIALTLVRGASGG